MATQRSDFGDLLEPGFREIFDDKFNEVDSLMERIFNVADSEKDSEKDSAVTGFGYPQETPEGGQIDYEDPVQMYDVTYTHVKYTKGFKVSREMWEDDLYNIIKKKPAALGRSFRRWRERSAALIFNRAFNSSYLGGDGEELCSTVHPRSDGGSSQSNASSTGVTLTEANLETGINAMRGQLDDKGMRIDVFPDMLLVPIELAKEAHEIINSSARSGTADNDANIYKDRWNLEIIDWIYMDGSATQWFLIDSNNHELNWFWRIRPEFKQDETFDTDMALFKARARWSNGWSDWRGVWGSQGDGNSYSS